MDNRYTNIKVGIITILGFIITVVLFTWKSSTYNYQGYEVIGSFENVGGLLETADVRYRGYNVGKVISIVPEADEIKVYVKVKNSITIPDDSRFQIAFDGLIGQKYINVKPGKSLQMLKPGDTIPGLSSAGIVDFIDEGARSMVEIQKTIRYINDLLDQGQLQSSILKSAKNIEQASKDIAYFGPKLNETAQHLNKILLSVEKAVVNDDNTNNIQLIVENLKATTAKLESFITELEKFSNNKENLKNLEASLKNIKEITETLNKKGVKMSVF